MSVAVDLHTHSAASPDGGLSVADYRQMLQRGQLDYIAVTDHGTTDFARQLQSGLEELGERIIVGQEVMTTAGEIIGLYIRETIPPQLSPADAVAAVRRQGGLVYIPHPFETLRHGLQRPALDALAAEVDIVEVYNGRALFRKYAKQAQAWQARQGCRGAAGSDCHGPRGWGRTYTVLTAAPSRQTLLPLLASARYVVRRPTLAALLAPKANRWRRRSARSRWHAEPQPPAPPEGQDYHYHA